MKRLLIITLLLLSVGLSQQIIHTETYENGNIKSITYHKETRKKIEKIKFVKYYENGQKKTEVNYKNGEKDVLITEWYNNGKKKSEVTFKNEKKDGLWISWHENGQKESEGTYKKGKKDGLFTDWYSNGQKMVEYTFTDGVSGLIAPKYWNEDESAKEPINITSLIESELGFKTKDTNKPYSGQVFSLFDDGGKYEEVTVKDGKRDGLLTVWYKNGQKKYEGIVKDGKEYGLWTSWDENGQKKSEKTYKNGKDDETIDRWNEEVIEVIRTYKKGNVKSITYHKKVWNGIEKVKRVEYYKTGRKNSEGTYKGEDVYGDPIKDGLWISWHENGQKESEGTYKKGKKDGLLTGWYYYGQKESEGTYKDGNEDGLHTTWYRNGQKESEGTYKVGEEEWGYLVPKQDGLWNFWYENGNKKMEGSYKDGELVFSTRWNENGEKEDEITYKDGKQNGLSIYFFDNGNKKGEGSFINGDGSDLTPIGIPNNGRDGLWKFWNENGQKSSEITYKDGKQDGSHKKYTWYENGQKKNELTLQGGSEYDRVWTENFENGQMFFKGILKDEKAIDGLVTGWYESGIMAFRTNQSIIQIRNENLEFELYVTVNGLSTTWDESGNISEEYMWFGGGDLWSKTYSNGVVFERWFNPHYFNNPSELTKEVFWDSKKYFQNWDGEIPNF